MVLDVKCDTGTIREVCHAACGDLTDEVGEGRDILGFHGWIAN